MTLLAIVALHESGLPIYKKFKKGRERPMEPLIAAILGLAHELKIGDISHVRFEKADLIVLRGFYDKSLLIALLVERADHMSYTWGIYLLRKIEKALGKLPDFVNENMEIKVREIAEPFFDKFKHIPDFIGESFTYAAQKFGPMFYSSLFLILYKRFNEDPLIKLVRNPKEFTIELDKFLGEESTNHFFFEMFRYFCETYPNICEEIDIADVRPALKRLLNTVRKKSKKQATEVFWSVLEQIIDVFITGKVS